MSFSSEDAHPLVPSVIDSGGAGNLVATLRRVLGRPVVLVRFRSDSEQILRSSSGRFSAKSDFQSTGEVTISHVAVIAFDTEGVVENLADMRINVQSLPESQDILDYLATGRKGQILSAMHHDLPYEHAAECDALHRRIARETGVYPALYSADFLTGETVPHRQNMIDEVIRQWNTGVLVQIMFHVSPPQFTVEEEVEGGWGTDAAEQTLPGPNRVYSYLSNQQWDDLLTEGSNLNANWRLRMDEYARFLIQLQNAGVTVMLRPFHEMNQHVFWWGGRPGRNGTAALFRMFRAYLRDEWNLTNAIWVWNVQDLPDDYGFEGGDDKFARYRNFSGGLDPYDADDWSSFSPGSDKYDVLSVDFYDDEGYSSRRHDHAHRIAELDKKPVIIGETFIFPTADELATQHAWALAMPWGIRTWRYNTPEVISAFYQTSIGAADLPRFHAGERAS